MHQINKPIKKILIANRGIIAKRIIRTCKELGLKTIALQSEKDSLRTHTFNADEIFTVSDYTNQKEILDLAKQTDSAIHPGYGFLAERSDFSELCQRENINFIGPSFQVLNMSGNKAFCNQELNKHKVIINPFFTFNEHSSINELSSIDNFPLIIKPALGGGGIGIYVVHNTKELESALKNAMSVSKKLFQSSDLIVEKYLPSAKHIEVQILADKEGNVLHLFERECSIQRRQQKLVEEALSPSLTENEREELYALAEKIAKTLKIDGVATIEFLYHEGFFYFLEINPRIQVEHAITEELTGIDLVEWQIRIANGESIKEAKVFQKTKGHAIEARIYAEDPISHLPQTGEVKFLSLPDGNNLRIESCIEVGSTISDIYDPLLMKVITSGKDRTQAIAKMTYALENLDVNGTFKTNTMAILKTMQAEAFIKNTYDTNTFESLGFTSKDEELATLVSQLIRAKEKKIVSNSNENKSSYWKPSFWGKNL